LNKNRILFIKFLKKLMIPVITKRKKMLNLFIHDFSQLNLNNNIAARPTTIAPAITGILLVKPSGDLVF